MDCIIEKKLDDILKKLAALDSIPKELERLKAELLDRSREQENAVKRLAGSFEHLINSQREIDTKLGNIAMRGRNIEEYFVRIFGADSEFDAMSENASDDHSRGEYLEDTERNSIEEPELLPIEKNVSVQAAAYCNKELLVETAKQDCSTDTKEMFQSAKADHSVDECITTVKQEEGGAELTKRYKCHSCKTLLPKRRDCCVKCSNKTCEKWNIAGTVVPGNKWVTLATPCGHVQQVPISRKVREPWTCTKCTKPGKIDYIFKIKECEEIVVDEAGDHEGKDDSRSACAKCLELLPPSFDPCFVTCPLCQNRNNFTMALSNDDETTVMKFSYKCIICNVELPTTRIEDGVSVHCRLCGTLNCAAPQKPGYRWTRLLKTSKDRHVLVCDHAEALPIDQPAFCPWKCKTCGAPGYITELANTASVDNVPIESDGKLLFKCNQCKTILPKSEDDDKVRISCPQCKNLNIVGRLQEGYKWVFLKSCNHFQQSERYNKSGEKIQCRVCGKEGTINDVQQRWIPLCEKSKDLPNPTESDYPEWQVVKECINCCELLPKTIREDGLTTKCLECGKVNVVAELKRGLRWAACDPCGHWLHIPITITSDFKAKCNICQKPAYIITKGLLINSGIE